MSFAEYKFNPEQKPKSEDFEERGLKERVKKAGLDLIIAGSIDNSSEENQEKLGEYVANIFAKTDNAARGEGKKVIFDMATGSSPKYIWSGIEKMVEEGLDISNVVVIGHEEAWGDYEPNSKSDFDAYRRREFFDRNKISVKTITSKEDVLKENFDGNFVPMHLTEDADSSASRYMQILQALKKRKDTISFGIYGVGTDGHIGEIQPHAMGREESLKRRHAYADNIEHYSVERGAFQWKKEQEEDFYPENNIFWQRGAKQEVGRAVWQGYANIESVMSLGWREMIDQDTLVLVFNDKSKSLAFALALEGSFSGDVKDNQGKVALEINKNSGEGPGILADLEKYAIQLEEKGILKKGSVSGSSQLPSNIHGLFKMIYKAFDDMNVSHDDPKYKELWGFTNRYLGKMAPVSQLIKLRSIRGKKTVMIATPGVVKDTKYDVLLKE